MQLYRDDIKLFLDLKLSKNVEDYIKVTVNVISSDRPLKKWHFRVS